MRYKKSSEEILPDKGMILQFINGKDISDEVIEFYDKYIIKISELMIIDSEYNIEVKYIDSDLMQDLYLSILECLPNLRKNIIRHLDSDDDFLIKMSIWNLMRKRIKIIFKKCPVKLDKSKFSVI